MPHQTTSGLALTTLQARWLAATSFAADREEINIASDSVAVSVGEIILCCETTFLTFLFCRSADWQLLSHFRRNAGALGAPGQPSILACTSNELRCDQPHRAHKLRSCDP